MKTISFIVWNIFTFLLVISIACNLNDIFDTVPSGNNTSTLTEAEVLSGLREALDVGIDSAAARLHIVNGYLLNEAIKIILPQDVATALDYVDSLQIKIGPLANIMKYAGIDPFDFSVFDGMRDSLTVSMNHAAEKAAPLSVDIFKAAIADMTIQDGFDILNGHDTAATIYLKQRTINPLTDEFKPFVATALAGVGTQILWEKISVNYNVVASLYRTIQDIPQLLHGDLPPLPFDSLSTDLAQYTTEKALNGLYYSIGEEEVRIRKDPVARVTEILQKVFGTLYE